MQLRYALLVLLFTTSVCAVPFPFSSPYQLPAVVESFDPVAVPSLFFENPFIFFTEIHSEEKIKLSELLSEPAFYIIRIDQKGFKPAFLEVKVGDTVEWQNIRSTYRLNKALIVGSWLCGHFQSPLLQINDTFSWTFTQEGKCQIVDAVTKQVGRIIIKS
ncbi:hypothetical protein COV20_01200 [Candidatus Woesearchaeota archaeon CG10_big_fil_rev_8_21_14_0_10_45_16]|nr:MAG: hypothetical protein COV20_01200 [Candidatus Woesearchaeota archaeon CG10_big_fil_rev_8_21_14_0_10_45_16]